MYVSKLTQGITFMYIVFMVWWAVKLYAQQLRSEIVFSCARKE